MTLCPISAATTLDGSEDSDIALFEASTWISAKSTPARRFEEASNGTSRRSHLLFEGRASTVQMVLDEPESRHAHTLLNQAYAQVARGNSSVAFKVICDSLERSFATDSLTFASELLRQIEPSLAGRFVSTGLLRATSRAKNRLPTWNKCATETIEYLISGKEDWPRIMRGLLPNSNALAK